MGRLLATLVVLPTLAACHGESSDTAALDQTPCTRQIVFEASSTTLSAPSKLSIDHIYGNRTCCAEKFGAGKSFDVVVLRTNESELSRTRAEMVRDYLGSIGLPPQAMQLVANRGAKSGVTIEFWPHALWQMRRNAFDRPG